MQSETQPTPLLIGGAAGHISLHPRFANRHGLIAGATGTGKTVTLQVLAEQFSRLGVPVFLSDVKGDLSGISQPGTDHPKIQERVEQIGIDGFGFDAVPTHFWDLWGEQGHPVRATISDMGPTLLSRLMDLNETQEGVLAVAFEYADDEGMLLLDLKDLQSMLTFMGENAKQIRTEYGNVSSASIGAIQRRLLLLEQAGAEHFFGEPALDLSDFLRTNSAGHGMVNILRADRLMTQPRLYATFLLWLLSELFEQLPEVGDLDKPKFVFFFDEAHLLFKDAPKALVEKVETVVKLIRSKGVGIYFITQNPMDVPDTVLGQLGNRVQHALRAFTPRDQRALKTAATTMRSNPDLDIERAISELGVGEALVSVLDENGVPTMTERTLIAPPRSRIGPATDTEKQQCIAQSSLGGIYDNSIDRESAYEILQARSEAKLRNFEAQPKKTGRKRQSVGETIVKSLARSMASSIGRTLGRQILRGLLGSIRR